MTGDGYAQTCSITPYIHVMIFHVPLMLPTYETMKLFTGQGKITTTIRAADQHCFSLTSLIEASRGENRKYKKVNKTEKNLFASPYLVVIILILF